VSFRIYFGIACFDFEKFLEPETIRRGEQVDKIGLMRQPPVGIEITDHKKFTYSIFLPSDP
jgi:hypothetical protein